MIYLLVIYTMALSQKKELEFETLYKSLVGSKIVIVESKNPNLIGKSGIVIHESANFFTLLENSRTSRILKRNVVFRAIIKGKPLYIDGRLLLSTLTNRIKKLK